MSTVGVMTAQPPYYYNRVTADEAVKSSSGFLHGILVSAVATNGTLTLYDSLTEVAPVITAIPLVTRAAGAQIPLWIPLDIEFNTGLYAGYDGTLVGEFLFVFK